MIDEKTRGTLGFVTSIMTMFDDVNAIVLLPRDTISRIDMTDPSAVREVEETSLRVRGSAARGVAPGLVDTATGRIFYPSGDGVVLLGEVSVDGELDAVIPLPLVDVDFTAKLKTNTGSFLFGEALGVDWYIIARIADVAHDIVKAVRGAEILDYIRVKNSLALTSDELASLENTAAGNPVSLTYQFYAAPDDESIVTIVMEVHAGEAIIEKTLNLVGGVNTRLVGALSKLTDARVVRFMSMLTSETLEIPVVEARGYSYIARVLLR